MRKVKQSKNADALLGFGENHKFFKLAIFDTAVVNQWNPTIIHSLQDKLITSFAAGLEHVIAVSSTGRVFSWGNNSRGCLGTGNSAPSTAVNIVKFPNTTEFIYKVASGAHHCLALAASGICYSFGDNSEGQLGQGETRSQTVCVPAPVIGIHEPIQDIQCGYFFSGCLTTTGEVYMFGCNSFGQIGASRKNKHFVPVKLNLNNIVSLSIAHGGSGSFAVNSDSEVFTWGFNDVHQLGLGHKSNVYYPQKMNFPEKVEKVYPASFHATALTKTGKLMAWGDNTYGQCGNGKELSSVPLPTIVQFFEKNPNIKIKKIACGWGYTIIMSEDGKLFGVGSNANGRLALDPKTTDTISYPQLLQLDYVKYKVLDVKASSRQSFVFVQYRGYWAFTETISPEFSDVIIKW